MYFAAPADCLRNRRASQMSAIATVFKGVASQVCEANVDPLALLQAHFRL
jgi:hypothetical protein